MREFLQSILLNQAKKIIARHRPTIIAVTGSFGKTATKDAIFAVLDDKQTARMSIKNYNNELGVPLTVIGEEAPGSSLVNWLFLFMAGRRALSDENYPKTLILEMAADRPGDLQKLVDVAAPKISIVTAVGPVHLEYFLTEENIAKEKSALVKVLPQDGTAILNGDDEKVDKMRELTKAKVMTYGFGENADIRGADIQRKTEGVGFLFKVYYDGKVIPAETNHLLAEYQIYSLLAAFAVAIALGKNPLDAAKQMSEFIPPPGRLKVLPGIKNTIIIDDTYNASPIAVRGAITVLKQAYPKARTWAVLGDMMELGGDSQNMHEEIGKHVFKTGVDYLATVGERSKDSARAARQAGMSEDKIFRFEKPEDAGKFLEDEIIPGDVLLVKGSQGARMEKIVKELMANPLDAPMLLVRQGKGWE